MDLDWVLERQVTPSCLARSDVLDPLRSVTTTGASVLAGEEVHLNGDCPTPDDDSPEEDERLRALHVSTGQKTPSNRPIAGVGELPVVKGKVHIDAADVVAGNVREQEGRDPTADENDPVPVGSEEVGQLEDD